VEGPLPNSFLAKTVSLQSLAVIAERLAVAWEWWGQGGNCPPEFGRSGETSSKARNSKIRVEKNEITRIPWAVRLSCLENTYSYPCFIGGGRF